MQLRDAVLLAVGVIVLVLLITSVAMQAVNMSRRQDAAYSSGDSLVPDLKQSCFDMVLYINLAHREDRLAEIHMELASLGWKETAKRVEAVYFPARGSFGCVQSHILALRTFLADPTARHVLILEDDCMFTRDPRPDIQRFLFMERNWDLLLLAANNPKTSRHSSSLLRVRSAATTSCYAVSRAFATRLLALWESTMDGFLDLPEEKVACDVTWNRLAPESRWFLVNPKAAIQRPSYSDIGKMYVAYGV